MFLIYHNILDSVVAELCCVVCFQVIHKHFYLKRTEIMSQCEEWIADIQQYSSDKRVGRTMSHHAAALKVLTFLDLFYSKRKPSNQFVFHL